jgi:glycosyltransferase involved in cell wall biosynthesis
VVISDALRKHYEDSYPALVDSVRTAPDAADEVPISVTSRNPGNLRVGYVGHLYQGRGIELIAQLAERCSWAEFHVIGGVPKDIDEWRARCQDRRNIVFHGFCPPAEVPARMSRLDVMLAPYQRAVTTYGERHDTSRWMSPLKIFEYMAAGKPMIASDLPVLREVLNESNAMLVDPEDVDAWAGALTALRDPERRQRLGSRAHSDFREAHTWEQRAHRVLV